MFLKSALLATAALSSSALAAFGVTKNGNNIVVDAGSSSPLVFTVNANSCDITSIKLRGEELQSPEKGSHISSGLGTATVKYETIGSQYIKVTCTTSTLTHYLVAKSGESTIYMATHTTAEPTIGELRFIARLKSASLPLEFPFGAVSTTAGSSSTVEGSDVFVVNSQTRSKFYSSERFIDDTRVSLSRDGTDAIHACFLLNSYSYEGSSGGPFFRDINTNNNGPSTSLTFYMNSGHVQTEKFRMGLHGPYALAFTRSGVPEGGSRLDTTFFKDLGITGYVAPSGRGTVSGTASGVGSSFQKVLHWYNDAAQYFAYADSAGKFTSPAMKPGTYTQVLYQGEFKVKAASVSVSAGKTTTANIAADTETKTSIWRIGEWDGQPKGFRNADKQLRMHPSDSRMASWGPLTYTVGSSSLDSVPMALVKDNNPLTIKFSNTYTAAATLRVGTTLSFAGCRPAVVVNSFNAAAPATPTKIDSRGFTRGAYRGFGEVYNYAIPAGTLVSGSNTITISCLSGAAGGGGFLSPNVILDAIELFR
ncbi:polysaccharide lyase family 4 protein [Cucurbitaria berberidis CBS 394.84]|uniref:Rhamnogalacturonate lyase n=1 Tax=Cucurbitaria berberidis CBS 394.84 TaxID=1168544 RepID=A0A9P4L4Q9_9PLEO|nr:polysaccharide lyase family 4 protein [Cucurbitaria berberidis CBS 394.84]KAF1841775.1 polysaccharide lyase family 4 protein [Cucurbitaria berberidis CBS 394.84]